MRYLLAAALVLFFFGLGCQSKSKYQVSERSLAASEHGHEIEDRQANEIRFRAVFDDFSQQIQDTNSDEEIRELMNNELFAKRHILVLKKSYQYMFDFDRKAEEIADGCSASQRENNECEDVMKSDIYTKLQAYRVISERIADRLQYFYLRILDIANSQDPSVRLIFSETKTHLEQVEASEGIEEVRAIVSDAIGIKNQWDQAIKQILEANYNEASDVFMYGTAIKLAEHREKAIKEYNSLTGRDYQTGLDIELHQKTLESLYDERRQLWKSETDQVRDQEDEEAIKVYEDLKSRSPDALSLSGFHNINGSNFNAWTLTYDDGPNSGSTLRILSLLQEYGVHATFFWLAQNVGSNQSTVNKVKEAGMGLASHSYTHANLSKRNANLRREIDDAQRVLQSSYGMAVNYFRLPYGAGVRKGNVKNRIKNAGMLHFFWNVDSLDWQDPSPSSIRNRILTQMRSKRGGIILLHDIHNKTVTATDLLLADLRQRGTQIVPLENQVTRINSEWSANGRVLLNQPDPDEDTQESDFPHFRIIIADSLNVRYQPTTSGNTPCGAYGNQQRIQVVGQDPSTGWYRVNTDNDKPRFENECSGEAWISGKALYSVRDF